MTMDSSSILISVIVAVYNAAPYMEKCLLSIMRQSHTCLEILIIDDGSVDGSGEICRRLAGEDQRITVWTQSNRGQGAARNVGLARAKGEYVAFADADDWLEPDMLEKLLALSLREQADMAVCAYTRRKKHVSSVQDIPPVSVLTGQEAMLHLFRGVWLNNFAWNKLFRRSLFEGEDFAEGKFFEEIPLMYRLFEKSEIVAFSPYPAYNYRIHPGSVTASRSLGVELDACDSHIDRFRDIARRRPELLCHLCLPLVRSLLHALYSGGRNPFAPRDLWRARRAAISLFLRDMREPLDRYLPAPCRWACRLFALDTWWADLLLLTGAFADKALHRLAPAFSCREEAVHA